MPSITFNLREIYKAVCYTYRSLVLSTCAAKREQGWVSLLTVVRFSYQQPAEIARSFDWLRENIGTIDNEYYKILRSVVPSDTGLEYLEEIGKSLSVDLQGTKVSLPGIGEISKQSSQIKPYAGMVKSGYETGFPCFELYTGDRLSDLYDRHFLLSINRMGIVDPNLALARLLGLSGIANFNFSLILSAPIYARVERIRWDSPVGLRFDLVQHVDMPRVATHISRVSADAYGQIQDVKQIVHGKAILHEQMPGPFTKTDCIASFQECSLTDWAGISLVQEELGELYSERERIAAYLPAQEKNPLVAITDLFCDRAKFEGLVTEPHGASRSETTFERAVTWLLSCGGFSVVWLGKSHEILREIGTNVELGSVDLIACHFTKNLVLLGGCTINVPSSRDIDGVAQLREHIRRRVGRVSNFTFQAVLFTSATEVAATRDAAERSGVRVFSGDELSKCVRNLGHMDQERWLREMFGPGMPWNHI